MVLVTPKEIYLTTLGYRCSRGYIHERRIKMTGKDLIIYILVNYEKHLRGDNEKTT